MIMTMSISARPLSIVRIVFMASPLLHFRNAPESTGNQKMVSLWKFLGHCINSLVQCITPASWK